MDFTFKNIVSGSETQTFLSLHLDVKEADGVFQYVTCSLEYCDPTKDYYCSSFETAVTTSTSSIVDSIEQAVLVATSASKP